MISVADIQPRGRVYVREWSDSDRAFIADSWAMTLRAASEESGSADWDAFRTQKAKAIDRILDTPSTRVRVAGPDDLVILGYLVYTPPNTLHMCFVRRGHRKKGIAHLLLTGINLEGAVVTQWSRDLGRWILGKTSREVARDKGGAPVMRSCLVYNPWKADP